MRAKKFFAAFLATALTVSGFAVGSPVTAKAASAEFTSVGGSMHRYLALKTLMLRVFPTAEQLPENLRDRILSIL